MNPLPTTFFARDTLLVARDMLGTHLVRRNPDGSARIGRVVETEAYTQDDPAFHGWGLLDPETGTLRHEGRAADLFKPPGTAYVYLIYGMHWLLNVVTEREGVGGAVLVRAVEPIEGIDRMRTSRSVEQDRDLTNGPGKLTQAFGIDGDDHTRDLTDPPIFFTRGHPVPDEQVDTTSRIGISKGVDRSWRFLIRGNRFVSPGTPSDHNA
ncbi:MAG: DNA-3-methyladenine glycosylase [Bacteroidetes bacterium]|jgi:DNA-3-methyladenine glycosylase|nr:DNA-3-methyladenine glycosylase [Bacteroidota bacterium]